MPGSFASSRRCSSHITVPPICLCILAVSAPVLSTPKLHRLYASVSVVSSTSTTRIEQPPESSSFCLLRPANAVQALRDTMHACCCPNSSAMSTRTPTLPVRKNVAFAAPCRQRIHRPVGQVALGAFGSTQLITTAALLVGAWYLSQQEAVAEQERLEASDRRPCPSCGGSGLQPCFCTKWSDGDVGCSSCSHSGWTKCSSCGGGGMAVPIKVSIRKNDAL